MKLVSPDDPILWTSAEPVTDIATQVIPHIEEMWRLMKVYRGIGLAAPQVGIGLRFFLMGSYLPESKLWHLDNVIINPTLVWKSDDDEIYNESCLSLPNYQRRVQRARYIQASWQDEHGQLTGICPLDGMDARCFLHELDHLDGICIFPRP